MNLKLGTRVFWVIIKDISKKKSKSLRRGHRPHPFDPDTILLIAFDGAVFTTLNFD